MAEGSALVPIGLMITAAGLELLTRIGTDSSYCVYVLAPLLLLAFGLGLTMAQCRTSR